MHIKNWDKKEKNTITYQLTGWGSWKRDYIVGLGYPSSGIEAAAMSGEMMGDGNYGGGKKEGSKNHVFFKESQEFEKVDIVIRKLRNKYPNEMKVLHLVFVLDWSCRKIAKESKLSRHTVNTHLNRAKSIINLSLDL